MCVNKKPPPPPEPQKIPLAPVMQAPIEADPSALMAGDDEKRRRKAATGRGDTILTSGLGLTGQATTGGKQILGG